MKFLLEAVLAACLLGFSVAVATEDDRKLQGGTLVDLAVGDPELSTLVTAVMAAGLVEVLSGPGPFTLFAPIDSAFAAVDPALLNQLLTPEFSLHLENLLAYHVAAGEVLSTDLFDGQLLEMSNTEQLTVEINDAGVFLTNPLTTEAQVIEPDLIASNGVAHKIGGSILFPSFVGRDLVDLLDSDPNYSTLAMLVQMAGLADTLRSAEALTVLAPDNTAFGSLPQDILDSLTADAAALQAVLMFHVIEGVFPSSSLTSGLVPTLNGESLEVVVDSEGGITFNGVPVVQPDGLARNGIAHGISSVLIPGGGPVDPGPAPPTGPGPAPPTGPGTAPPVGPGTAPPVGPPPSSGVCDGIVLGGFGS